jgi:cytochrome c oxidase subunit 2
MSRLLRSVHSRAAQVSLAVLLALSGARHAGANGAPRVVEITAQRFSFTPNSVTLRTGEPVTLRLTSTDVTHGLFVRPLKIDALILPGKVTEIALTPEKLGTYVAICHHFCGVNHGAMKMTIVVE